MSGDDEDGTKVYMNEAWNWNEGLDCNWIRKLLGDGGISLFTKNFDPETSSFSVVLVCIINRAED